MKEKGFGHIFTWRLLLLLFSGLAVSNTIFYFLVSRPLGGTYQSAFQTLSHASGAAAGYLIRIDTYGVAILAALIFYASLLMSHRISGPVYRFERTAEALADGDFSLTVRLREKDEFKEAAAGMDAAVVEIRGRLRELKELSREAAGAARSLEGGCSDARTCRKKAADLLDLAGEIKEKAAFFKF